MRSEVPKIGVVGIPSLSDTAVEPWGANHLAAREFDHRARMCQGTTLVVPQMQQDERGALAPAGMRLFADVAEGSAWR